METVEQTDLARWMDLQAEGLLNAAEKVRLDELLKGKQDRRLVAEQTCWDQLHAALREDHCPVREGFRDEVMASVDLSQWQERQASAWQLPVAAMMLLTLGAVWSLNGVAADSPAFGAASAIGDFVQTTLLAGAGVTVASWRGIGMGLEELLAGSAMQWVALSLMVACVNLLFFSLLRRRPGAARAVAGRPTTGLSARANDPDTPS